MASELQAQTLINKPVGILFLDHTAQLGGGEIALLRLASNLDRDRFRPVVVLFSSGPLEEHLRGAGVEVRVFPLDERITNTRKDAIGVGTLLRLRDIWAMLTFARRLSKLIRSLDIQIVHANSLKADIIGAIAGRLAGKWVIWHVRDRIASDYLPPLVATAFRILCRVFPHYVIANSASTLNTIGQRSAATAIPSGIELHRRAQIVHDGISATAPSSKTQSSDRGYRIGLIGRLAPWKGQHVFIQAASLVLKRYPSAKFLIVGSAMFGETAYENELRETVAKMQLGDCVQFLGFREDVTDVIESLDILVHASTTPEPFGQVVIEGMAAGKPVIGTRGGGVLEIIEDRVNGRLVSMGSAGEMGDAICDLLDDPQAASLLGMQARAHVARHFSIDATVRKVQSVYDQLLGTSPSVTRSEVAVAS